MNGTAVVVKDIGASSSGAHQIVYECSPPLEGHRYVVVSAVVVPWTGPETYIFASDRKGNVSDWAELTGSFRGGLDHEKALAGAGYSVGATADAL